MLAGFSRDADQVSARRGLSETIISAFAPTTRMARMEQRPKKRRARRGEPVPDGATLIVRGDLLDPHELQEYAADNFEI
jgi:hypothetical protein